MKKFLRTTITGIKGEIIPARVNLSTGEIKPFKYALEHFQKPTGTINTNPDSILFWQVIDQSKKVPIVSRETKPRKTKQNANNIYLKDYETLDDAKQDINLLDNLITGVSHLHSGRVPTCKGLLFRLLRDLDDIDAATIQAYTGHSPEYSRKLAQYLRVLSIAFDSEVEK